MILIDCLKCHFGTSSQRLAQRLGRQLRVEAHKRLSQTAFQHHVAVASSLRDYQLRPMGHEPGGDLL